MGTSNVCQRWREKRVKHRTSSRGRSSTTFCVPDLDWEPIFGVTCLPRVEGRQDGVWVVGVVKLSHSEGGSAVTTLLPLSWLAINGMSTSDLSLTSSPAVIVSSKKIYREWLAHTPFVDEHVGNLFFIIVS